MSNNSSIFDITLSTSEQPHTTNTTNGSVHPNNYLDIPKDILYGIYVFNGILALLGLSGNIFVCFVIVRGRKMYTIANLFLMNLAIADLFILGLSYPLWIMQATIPDSWPFGSALCKLILPLSDVFYGVSLGCMMAISFHRYRMIIYSMNTQMGFVHAKVIIIFFYGISLVTISAPTYPMMRYTRGFHNNTNTDHNDTNMAAQEYKRCHQVPPSWTYERCYMIYLALVWYIIPLLIILYTYVRIKWYLQKQISCHWLATSLDDMAMKAHVLGIKNALRLLAPVVVVFAIMMLPWNVLRVIAVFKRLEEFHYLGVYLLVGSTMLVANSAVNPFIYYITSRDFRTEFRKRFSDVSVCFKPSSRRGDDVELFEERNGGTRRLLSTSSTGGSRRIRLSTHETVAGLECNNNDYSKVTPNFDELFEDYQKNKNATLLSTDTTSTNYSSEEKGSAVFDDVADNSRLIEANTESVADVNAKLCPNVEERSEIAGMNQQCFDKSTETVL